jgi:putative peptidoglycan lipid II flippase
MTHPHNDDRPPTTVSENHRIGRAAGIIGGATFLSRILGFIRDIVLANLFGANPAADAFYMAYRIPNFLRELFAEGSMSSAFIPVFTEYHSTKTREEAWKLANAAFTTLLTLVSFVTVLGILAAPGIVWLLAPGFRDDASKLATTTLLTQIMFPYLTFVSLAALAMGILNSLRSFAVPALSPVFFNLCVIAFAAGLSPLSTQPITVVAIGIVIGGLAQFLMQLPALGKHGMRLSWHFQPTHSGVKQIGRLIIPSLLGLAVTQINLTVSTILASYFPGGPTYLFYGMRLIQFPLGIFGVAMATAILPSLSAQAARRSFEEIRETVTFGLRMVLFIILPSMAGLMLLRIPILHLFFEHGAFSAHDTAGTASALLGFSVGLWAFASYRIVATAFYSLQDTRTPAGVAVLSVLVNLGLSLWLMNPLGHMGLALATGLSGIFTTVLLLSLLHRRLQGLLWEELGRSIGRTALALLPLVGTTFWIAGMPLWQTPGNTGWKILWLGTAVSVSAIGYFGTHRLLHSAELAQFVMILRNRMPKPFSK